MKEFLVGLSLLVVACGDDVLGSDADPGTSEDAMGDTRPPTDAGEFGLRPPWDDERNDPEAESIPATGVLDVAPEAEPEDCLAEATCVGTALTSHLELDSTCDAPQCGAFSRMGAVTAGANGLILGEQSGDVLLPSGYLASIDAGAADVLIASGRLEVNDCPAETCVRSAALAFVDADLSDPREGLVNAVAAVRLVAEPELGAPPAIQFVVGRTIHATEMLEFGTPVDVQLVLYPSGRVDFFAEQGGTAHTPSSADVVMPSSLALAAYGYGDSNAAEHAVVQSGRLDLVDGFWPAAGERSGVDGRLDSAFSSGGATIEIARVGSELRFTGATGIANMLEDPFPSAPVRLVHHTGLAEPRFGLLWDRPVGFTYLSLVPEEAGDWTFEVAGARLEEAQIDLPPAPGGFRVVDMMMYHNTPLLLGAAGSRFELFGLYLGRWKPIAGYDFESTATSAAIIRAFGHLLVAAEIPQGTRSRIELWSFRDDGARRRFDLVVPSGESGAADAFGALAPSFRIADDFLTVFYTGDSRITTSRMRIDVNVPQGRRELTLPISLD